MAPSTLRLCAARRRIHYPFRQRWAIFWVRRDCGLTWGDLWADVVFVVRG